MISRPIARPHPNRIVHGIPFELDATERATLAAAEALTTRRRVFDIQVADCHDAQGRAGILIDRMYATRGYLSNGLSRRTDDQRVTLVASEGDTVVGTLTLGFDHPSGLLVDELFGAEVDAMRDAGLALCEFTKLAIDGAMRSRRLTASLFHAAYLFAHPLMAADRLLIEVNPRHVGYYRRMLGFRPIGAPHVNPRVDAPAVLMALDLEHARRQIDSVGGTAIAGPVDTRSLYPFFFAPDEERRILARARRNLPFQEPSDPTRSVSSTAGHRGYRSGPA